tara:strand:- start:481 stop:2751 length:2271 start_codon:yes stop_codon:yes gene_type:complete
MRTATEKYNAVLEGNLSKQVFVQQMRSEFPQFITNSNAYTDTVQILKNKGMIFENQSAPKKSINQLADNFNINVVERGIDYELEAKGIDSTTNVAKADYYAARQIVISNLQKNQNHYINMIAGEDNNVDKHDKRVEVKRGEKQVDVFNGLKNATLKEGVYTEDAEEDAKNDMDNATGWHDDPRKDEGSEEAVDPAVYGDIGAAYLAGFKKEHALSLDQLEELGRKIVKQLYKGDLEAAKAKHLKEEMYGADDDEWEAEQVTHRVKEISHLFKGYDEQVIHDFVKTHRQDIRGASDEEINAEFEEFVSVNYESGTDMQENEVEEAMSDEFMDDVKNYKKEEEGKPYRIGDKFTSDFDYEGMLKTGLKVRINTPLKTMQAIFDSFEDVNYHSEGMHLSYVIDAVEAGDREEALDNLKQFRAAINKTLTGLFEGLFPVREAEEGYIKREKRVEGLYEARRKKVQGGKIVTENDYETGGYVESMGPQFDKAVDLVVSEFGEWKAGPMTEPGMIPHAKSDVISYIDQKLEASLAEEVGPPGDVCSKCDGSGCDHCDGKGYHDESEVNEKKGKDLDKDGDVDGDDYKKAKDIAIKKALKENVKGMIVNMLRENTINEAATAKLAEWGESYEGFEGIKPVVNELENLVTEIEAFYDKMRGKIQGAFAKTADFRNEEGLKIGAFIAPSLEAAFRKDLAPVVKQGLTKNVDLPKVRQISSKEIENMKQQDGSEFNPGLSEEPAVKQSIFSPNISERKTKYSKRSK